MFERERQEEEMPEQNVTKGSCACGACTVELRGEPAMVLQCHCLNCQKSSGTGHVPFAGFHESQVTIKGKTKAYSYKADSGNTATSNFCPECGSPVFATTTGFPGVIAIRLGTMEDSSAFAPQMRVYDKRVRRWDHDLAKEAPSFSGMPPMQRPA
jgi:hypothetical protein